MTIKLEILDQEEDQLQCKLEDDTKIWIKNKTNTSNLVGKRGEASLLAVVNNSSWESPTRKLDEEVGIRYDKGFSNRLVNEVVGEVKEYDPESLIDSRWPLIEIQTGIGTVFIEHHNVPLSPNKEQYKKGRKAQVIAEEIQIHNIEV